MAAPRNGKERVRLENPVPGWTSVFMDHLLAAGDCGLEAWELQTQAHEVYIEGGFKRAAKGYRKAAEALHDQADRLAMMAAILESARSIGS